MTAPRFERTLVVGGSGMLAGCCRRLLPLSSELFIMARNESGIRAVTSEAIPLVCDYNDEVAALRLLDEHTFDLVVVWVYGRIMPFRRALAVRVRPGGRFLQVLGSAHADPSHPDRLEDMKAVAADLPLSYQAVVLGFVVEGSMSRWLTDPEISDSAFAAIESGSPLTMVGTVAPWSARP